VNNFLRLVSIFIFLGSCSLHKDSKFWSKRNIIKEKNENTEEILKINKNINKEFNPNLKITLYSKLINKSFLKNFDNNNGRINFDGKLKSISKYKFSKIKNFYQYDPKVSFYNNDIIFFDNKGTILRFNNESDLIWKKNIYSKSEKKNNPILFFQNNKKILIVADNISKYYALDINTGKILWSKNNTASFNSQIKIYKNKFFVIDFENILRAYSVDNGKEIWNVKTENSLIRSQKKLSLIVIKNKIYFNNSSGDISSVDIETGELLWQMPTQSSLIYDESFALKTSDIIADNETIYFSNNKNQFFSLDIQTGTLNWKQKINSNLRSTIIDDYIFTVSLDGYLIIIDKNLGNIIRITDAFKNFKIKKRNKIQPTGFIVGNNKVYITTDHGRLVILDVITGNILDIMKIDNNKISRPLILNKNMFIITDNSIIKLN
jgi:outer membrane protein assembly factor BamB|tara:strand:+ start:630 stop:1931 length:1302 start_codon:yes stop_codon:yes gene_type:complete